MDPLVVGMVGCRLDGGRDAETGNLRRLVAAVEAAEARMYGMESRG